MKEYCGNIITIDDSQTVQLLLNELLADQFIIKAFLDPVLGLEDIRKNSYDCVILDLMMPQLSGREVLIELRKFDKDIPVLILTAKQCPDNEIAELFKLGANDFVVKPFFSAELHARLAHHINLKRTKQDLVNTNTELQKAISREEKLNEKVIEKTIALKRSIHKIKVLNRKLRYFATHDKLTGFLNRRAFFAFLDNDIKRLKRIDSKLSILMLDLDFFKKINDTYGHLIGDFVLIEFSTLIREKLRDIDLVGRYGGEEFLILLTDSDIEHSFIVGNKIRNLVEKTHFNKDGLELSITVSIGVAEYKPGEKTDKLIKRVDEALYKAKNSGRNITIKAE